MKKTARDYFLKVLIPFVKNNMVELNKIDSQVTIESLNRLKDPNEYECEMDFLICYVINNNFEEFQQIEANIKGTKYSLIYKINNKYIRLETLPGKWISDPVPMVYDFVKLVKKKITIFEYEKIE